jgi:hypothetical protein
MTRSMLRIVYLLLLNGLSTVVEGKKTVAFGFAIGSLVEAYIVTYDVLKQYARHSQIFCTLLYERLRQSNSARQTKATLCEQCKQDRT